MPSFARLIVAAVTTLSPAAVWASNAGQSSTAGDRYGDVLRAARCQDFTNSFSKGYTKVTLDRTGAGSFPVDELAFQANPQWRPSGWTADDLFQGTSPRKGNVYRRYGTPRGAPAGTYNLTFVVMSNDDAVFLCIQGTEPSIFPGGKPKGNTMNNLNAVPIRLPAFDRSALVHDGWAKVATHYHKSVFPRILAEHRLKAGNKKLYLVGHSQGAALAGYLGFLFVSRGDLPRGRRHRLVTLAAPRYGTDTFLRRFSAELRRKAPNMTVDALETEGDLVPVVWPAGTVPVGKLWVARPADIRSDHTQSYWGAHDVANAGYLAKKIIATRGAYRPSNVVTDTTKAIGKTFTVSCPRGFKKGAVNCIATGCPSGFVKKGGGCVSACPPGSRHSGTGNHCLTGSRPYKESVKKVWVGNFKPKRKYKKACPKGTTYSHDLAGYTYCKSAGCPASHPSRRGLNCHTKCGRLKTDAFGNCEVQRKPLATTAFQCPSGYVSRGPVCFKR